MRRLPAVALAVLLATSSARAQFVPSRGWALDRYDPTPPGEGALLLDLPVYARAWDLGASLALSHAVDPLVRRRSFADGRVERSSIVSAMTVAHVTVGGTFAGRASVDFSFPVSLYQDGAQALLGVAVLAPAESVVVGDARIGGRVRLWGRAGRDPVSLHAGAWLWFPTGSRRGNTTDGDARFEARLVAAGRAGRLRWSASAGVRLRREAEALNLAVGHELRVTAGALVDVVRDRFWIGPELFVYTPLIGLPEGVGSAAFTVGQWGMEALASAHVRVAGGLVLGAGGGVGVERGAGIPAGRFVLVASWRGVTTPTPAVVE